MSPLSIQLLLASPRRIARPFQALPLWVLLAAVATTAGAALFLRAQLESRRAAEEQKLVAIADLEAKDVERWHEELGRRAGLVARRASVREALAALADGALPAASDTVLDELAASDGYRAAWAIAGDGRVVASSTASGEPAAEVRDIGVAALKERRIFVAEPAEHGRWFATAVPVYGDDGRAHAAVVLAMPARETVLARLRWPVPSATGEIRVLRRGGDAAELVAPGVTQAREVLPPGIGAATGEQVGATTLEGRATLAVLRPIRGTGWSLLATVATEEVDQPTWRLAGEVVAISLAIFFATVVALVADARRKAAEVRSREETLESARELARHAALLDSTMAHELNGPLACMLANARYALDELRKRPGARLDDAAEALEDAVDATIRAAAVVRDLQVFAQTGTRPTNVIDLRRSA